MPDRILRVVAFGPCPDDRRIILIEMAMDSASNYELARSVIKDRIKNAGLIMSSPMFWICKQEHKACVLLIYN